MSLSWFLEYICPDAADRNCLRPGIDEVAIQSVAIGGGVGCQTVQALVHQSSDLEDYPLSQRHPMKITPHRRDVIVFFCTSDESCRRILYTLQTSQKVLADTI